MSTFSDLKKMLQDLHRQVEGNISSSEQYKKAKDGFEDLNTKIKDFAKDNTMFGGILGTLVRTVEREIDRAGKMFEKAPDPFEGFDLLNDPQALEKVERYLKFLEDNYKSMDQKQVGLSLDPLITVVGSFYVDVAPTSDVEEELFQSISKRALDLSNSIDAFFARPVYKYKETKFDIFAADFTTRYRVFLEDVALNSPNKTYEELLDCGRVLRIISDDVRNTSPQNSNEQSFLKEVAFQTPLLLKVVDRQLILKAPSKPVEPVRPASKKAAKASKGKPATKTGAKPAPKSVGKKTSKATKRAVTTPARGKKTGV